MKKLTHEHLIQAGMPAWEVNKFKLQWPDGVDVTPKNYELAERLGFGIATLFAAVCPSKKMMDEWYEYHSSSAQENEIRKECDARIEDVRRQVKADQTAKHCRLICAAMGL